MAITVPPLYGQLFYILASVSCFIVGGGLLKHDNKSIKYLSALNIALGTWIGFLFITTVTSPPINNIVAKLSYFPFGTIPLFLFFFTVYYGENKMLQESKYTKLLFIQPFIGVSLAITNPFEAFLVTSTPTNVGIIEEWGWMYWTYASLSYTLIIASGIIFIRALITRKHSIYYGQIGLIIITIAIGLGSNVLYVFTDTIFNTTAVGAAAASILFSISIVRYDLTELIPIARQEIIENIRDGIIVINNEDKILNINYKTTKLLDISNNDIGKTYSDVINEKTITNAIKELLDNDEKTKQIEYKDRFIEITVDEIPGRENNIIGQTLLVKDITQKERQRRELRDKNERLDKFAETVAHDLRNPLSIATGFTQQANRTNDTKLLEEVEKQHERMDTMIDDILELSKTGGELNEVNETTIRELANDAWETADTKENTLENHFTDNILIECDTVKTRNIFENLFRNTADHNDDAVTVHTGVISRGGTRHRTIPEDELIGFYIEDTGVGIPDDKHDKVFEHGHTTSDEGTGFGMSIVDDIVSAHDWDITVENGEEDGARFAITGVDSLKHVSETESEEQTTTNENVYQDN